MGNTYFNNKQIKDIFLNNQRFKKMYLGINIILDYLANAFSSFKSRVLADAGTFENDNAINDLTADLLQEASLVITPNGVKTSKLYAIKPEDGSGDLTVTRATTATRVNASGIREVVPANTARIDYSTGNGMILVEPQRTNLVLRSEEFNNTYWGKGNATITANTTISPDGVMDADTITVTSIGNNLAQTITVTASTTYTFSFYVLRGSMTDLKYSVYNLSGTANIVAPTSYYSQTSASNWVRVSVTFTTPVGCTSINIYPIRDTGATGTVFLWGAQLEAGSNATSYIPTTTSSVTRNADVISKSGISSLIGQTQGSLVYYFLINNKNLIPNISLSNNGVNPRFYPFINGTNYNFFLQTSSAILVNYLYPFTNFIIGLNKIGVTYGAGSFKIYINGNFITSIPYTEQNLSFSKLNIGSAINNEVGITSNNTLISIYTTILSESKMIQLTTL